MNSHSVLFVHDERQKDFDDDIRLFKNDANNAINRQRARKRPSGRNPNVHRRTWVDNRGALTQFICDLAFDIYFNYSEKAQYLDE